MNRLVPICAALLLALLLPSVTLAHFGAEAFIHVPRDHVNPGEEFPVIAADLDPDAQVPITLVHDGTVVNLGTVATDADGHFEATLLMPATVPHGYAQIVATSSGVGEVGAWVRIGPREGLGPVPPGATGPPAVNPLTDPSVLVLIAVVGGAIVALGFVLLRPRSQASGARAGGSPAQRRMPSKRRSASRH